MILVDHQLQMSQGLEVGKAHAKRSGAYGMQEGFASICAVRGTSVLGAAGGVLSTVVRSFLQTQVCYPEMPPYLYRNIHTSAGEKLSTLLSHRNRALAPLHVHIQPPRNQEMK